MGASFKLGLVLFPAVELPQVAMVALDSIQVDSFFLQAVGGGGDENTGVSIGFPKAPSILATVK